MKRVTIGDYLLIAEAITGIDAHRLAEMPRVIPSAESALAAPFAGHGEIDFYEGLTLKAAVLCSRLVRNHPLIDGNKRAAYVTMIRFLRANGAAWTPSSSEDERAAMIERLAAGELDERAFAAWVAAQVT